MGGVARRAWARNPNSIAVAVAFNEENMETDHISIPYTPKDDLIKSAVHEALKRKKFMP